MKGFGKKTLAMALTLALTLAVAMSLSVGVWAVGDNTVAVGGEIELTVSKTELQGKTLEWSSDKTDIATVSNGKVTGVKKGTATITATASDTTNSETFSVEVVPATVTKVTPPSTPTYGLGTDTATVVAALPSTVDATVEGEGLSSTTKKVAVKWNEDKAFSMPTSVSGIPANGLADINGTLDDSNYELASGVAIKCQVRIRESSPVNDISRVEVATSSDRVTITNLNAIVFAQVKDQYKLTGSLSNSDTFNYKTLSGEGSVSSDRFTWDLSSSQASTLRSDGRISTRIDYTATIGGLKYDGSIRLTVYNADISGTIFDNEGGTLSKIGVELDARATAAGASSGYRIVLDLSDMDGGELLTEDGDPVDEDEYYTLSEFKAMFYQPNGSGDDSELGYYVYRSSSSSSEIISGTIYLESEEFLAISIDLTSEDTYTLDASDFQNALNDMRKYEDDTFYSVKFSFTSSAKNGYLVEDYDDGTSLSKQDKATGTYYADPEGKQDGIDLVTYVPGSDTTGTITINFTSKIIRDGKTSTTTGPDGALQITVRKLADINIYVANDGDTDFPVSYFEEYLDEEDITYNTIGYVRFEDMPNSKTAGYCYYDGDKIKASGVNFYTDDYTGTLKKTDKLLDDLTYEAGSKDDTVHSAEVTIYYLKTSSSKSYSSKKATMDIIVGDGGGSGSGTSGSKTGKVTMKSTYVSTPVGLSRSDFLTIGRGTEKNPNTYVVFTALPKQGKLWTNYGSSSQREVQLGVQYSLASTNPLAANNGTLFSSISYVPAYSRSGYNVEFTCTAYVDAKKSATITVSGQVYASTSSQFFNDVSGSYADSVDFLYRRGITTGYGTSSTFAPNRSVTRGEFVTFMYRAAGSPTVTGTNNFKDVSASAYYYNAVRWAVQNNITTGYSATSFMPNKEVTQQELLTFLYRYDVNYMRHTNRGGSLSGFSDANQLDSWARTAAEWAVGKGVVDGGTLAPKTNGTRATVALWLHRMLTL